MPTVTKLSISLPPDLMREIELRGDNVSGTIAMCLERYFWLLEASRQSWCGRVGNETAARVVTTLSTLSWRIPPVFIPPSSITALGQDSANDQTGQLDRFALVDAAERYVLAWQADKSADPLKALE